MKRVVIASLIAAGLSATPPAWAHHSFGATYDEEKTQAIEGDLVQFELRNPHSFVRVDRRDDHGRVQRWAIEWGSSLQLSRQGVGRDTLKPGDHLIITGSPSRTPDDHRLRLRTIVRPKDGWKWGGAFEHPMAR